MAFRLRAVIPGKRHERIARIGYLRGSSAVLSRLTARILRDPRQIVIDCSDDAAFWFVAPDRPGGTSKNNVCSRPPPIATAPVFSAAVTGSGLAAKTTRVTRVTTPISPAVVPSATAIPAANAPSVAIVTLPKGLLRAESAPNTTAERPEESQPASGRARN